MVENAARITLEAVEYALVDGVYSAYKTLRQGVTEMLAELDLTEALADALWQLDPNGVPLSRRALAERLNCDPSNVTFLVDRLEEKGFVERAPDPGDRRVKAVSLTAAGASARERIVYRTATSSTFASLSRVEKEQLANLLRKARGAQVPSG